jgi:partner of Y14 and mago protein
MADRTNAGIIQVGEERWIPGSQRADGSYRKERKVRPGFVPLEDVKRYSNARLESAKQPSHPPGYKPKPEIPGAKKKEVVKEAKPVVKKDQTPPAVDQTKEKKIKALNKKIRQIADLEQKLIKGETLNEEQHEKVKKGKSLREELAKLSL